MGRTKQTKRKAKSKGVEEVGSSVLCGVCGEVCKRGAQLQCCGARACRDCAVLKINKTKKCWKEDCGKDVNANTNLKNDEVLRKAVDFYKENGKMNPEHAKQLKKTASGTTVETKKKVISKTAKETEEKGEKKKPLDPGEMFNRPCSMGEKCTRKGCLFEHDKPTRADKAKRVKGNGKPCNKGPVCINKKCVYAHPDVPVIDKPSKWGSKSRIKDFKFNHKLAPLMVGMGQMEGGMAPMKRGMGPRGGKMGPMEPMRGEMGPMDGKMGPMGGGREPMGERMGPMIGGRGPMGGGMGSMDGGMGPMGGGRGPMGGGMGSMDGGMGPMGGGRGPMGGGMGSMCGGMGLMGGGRGPMGGGMAPMDGGREPMGGGMRSLWVMSNTGNGGSMGDSWKKGFRPNGMGSGTMGRGYGGGSGF